MSFAKSFIAVGLASVLQIGAALAQNGAAQKKTCRTAKVATGNREDGCLGHVPARTEEN